jgi:hypothetical protein
MVAFRHICCWCIVGMCAAGSIGLVCLWHVRTFLADAFCVDVPG